MSKFKVGDRIEWFNTYDNKVEQGTVIETPKGGFTRDGVVWAIWDDDKSKAYIDESSVKLVASSSEYNCQAWTKFVLDNAEEIREIPGKHYALIRKAFEVGFNSKG